MTERELQALDIDSMTLADWQALSPHDDSRLTQIDRQRVADKAVRDANHIHRSNQA